MKKIPLVFIALALTCGAVFSQGSVKITGELQTGAQDVVSIGPAAVTDAVSLYDINTGDPTRFRIGLSFLSDDGNWGITTRLDIGSNPVVLPLFASWNRALAWGRLFDGMLVLKAGILDEEAFSFTWTPWGAENVWGGQSDGTLGLEAAVQPFPAFRVGYVLPVADGTTFVDSLRASIFGLSYTVPELLRLVGGVQLTKQVDITLGVTTAISSAWVGAEVLPMKDLSVRLAVQGSSIGGAFPWIQLYEEVGYILGPVSFNLKGWEESYTVVNSSLGWQVEPTVSYALGSITLGVAADAGTLLKLDPNPGVTPLPFGFAGEAFASFILAPTSVIKAGGRYLLPDTSQNASTVQVFISYAWAF